MFCVKCGTQIEDDALFCTSCGAKVEDNAPTNNVILEDKDLEKKKGSGKKVVAVAAVVVVLVAAIGAFCLLGIGADKPSGGTNEEDSPASSLPADSSSTNTEDSAASEETGVLSGSETSEDPLPQEEPFEEEPLDFVGINGASASSVLPTDSINTKSYASSNLIDGDTATVWCEGVDGGGKGEYVTLSGPQKQRFSGFVIWNGYQESSHLYSINSRPKRIAVYADDALVGKYTLKDKKLKSQKITFDEPVDASSLKIEILSIYKGSKYLDCCISEIECF